ERVLQRVQVSISVGSNAHQVVELTGGCAGRTETAEEVAEDVEPEDSSRRAYVYVPKVVDRDPGCEVICEPCRNQRARGCGLAHNASVQRVDETVWVRSNSSGKCAARLEPRPPPKIRACCGVLLYACEGSALGYIHNGGGIDGKVLKAQENRIREPIRSPFCQ